MTYHSKNDYYEIKLASLITNVDKDVLVELYQPLIGSQATILYLTILKEKRNESESHFYQLDRLLRTMQLSPSELLSARRFLEAVGLMRTYELQQDDVRTYLFVLYAPKSPKAFFDDVLFKGLLIQYVGEKEAKSLANKYKLDLNITEDYKEVSASFVDVYKPDYDDPAFKKNLGNGILGREHGRANIDFNYDLFFGYIADNSTLNVSSLKKREMKEVERLATLFGLDEKQMAFIVIDEYRNENDHIDFVSLKNRCEDEIRFSSRIVTHKAKVSGDTIMAKKIEMMEEVAPAKFLSYLQKGTKPAKSDIDTIDSLSKNYRFNKGIINVILDYVITKNNGYLSKNYCESIASTLARNDIHTTVDAMNCLNSILLKNKSTKKAEPVSIDTKDSAKSKVELDDIYDFIDELEVMKNGK